MKAAATAEKHKRRSRRWRTARRALVALLALALVARLALPFALPAVLDSVAGWYGLTARYEALELSLLGGEVTLRELRVGGGGAPYLDLDYAHVDLDVSALWTGTLRLHRDGDELLATAWGAGTAWLLEQSDAVAGLRDDISTFAEVADRHPVVAALHHRHAGMRLAATGRPYQRLLRTVFEQKVTGKEAYRAYTATVRYCHRTTGREPAPGPVPGLLPPPDPATVMDILARHGIRFVEPAAA